jgi:NAD(P)-dependent dehydrogenase (short-subunit alcohol dehydrogenase family)
MTSLKNNVIMITGSSLGIGRHAAYGFARHGARLIITYCHDQEEGERTAHVCEELGSPQVLLLRLDVADLDSIQNTVGRVNETFGGMDILVNNAGIIYWKTLDELTYEEIEKLIQVNLIGLIHMTKAALPHVKQAVINIGSGSGKRGYAQLTPYCATKFGVRGFTQALANETDVKVFCVNPPLTSTRMSDFSGIPVERVADVIVETAQNFTKIETGRDIDVPRE